MTRDELFRTLETAPLIASVQASEGSPVDSPEVLLSLARASLKESVTFLRLQGIDNIRTIKSATETPVIGLIKRTYPSSEVYITPTSTELKLLLEAGCEVIALDGTPRSRPNGGSLGDLIQVIHSHGRLAMADCDSVESARYAVGCSADFVGTTLAGYTGTGKASGPDLELVRAIVDAGIPCIAEGRYTERWQVEAALRIGAKAVVVGGALNDPVKQTRALLPRHLRTGAKVGAVDIGGTWLRFANFGTDWKLDNVDRVPNPPTREERLAWIRQKAKDAGVQVLGVSSGGVIDPATGICVTAKEYLMHDQIGIEFSERTLGVPTFAHGDGHATAWGHANLPQYAGRRVATLALGTGVGCGFVQDGKIWMGRQGDYPRINDLPTSFGNSYEDALGGLHLTKTPSEEQKTKALMAFQGALSAIRTLYFPDDIVIAGSVGLSDWMQPELEKESVAASPFGHDAGLYGAAALALFPA